MKIRMLATGNVENHATDYATRLIHMGKAIPEAAEEARTEDAAEAETEAAEETERAEAGKETPEETEKAARGKNRNRK